MTVKRPTMPQGMGTAGRKLWRDVTTGYRLRVDEVRILEDACRERDLIAAMMDHFTETPKMMVKGSMGQPVINPIISELRMHRATFASLMRQLALPEDTVAETNQARDAAASRWTVHRGA